MKVISIFMLSFLLVGCASLSGKIDPKTKEISFNWFRFGSFSSDKIVGSFDNEKFTLSVTKSSGDAGAMAEVASKAIDLAGKGAIIP